MDQNNVETARKELDELVAEIREHLDNLTPENINEKPAYMLFRISHNGEKTDITETCVFTSQRDKFVLTMALIEQAASSPSK